MKCPVNTLFFSCEAQRITPSFKSRCRSNWRKGKAITGEDLADYGLIGEKSAEAIVGAGNEPRIDKVEVSQGSEGLNVGLSRI